MVLSLRPPRWAREAASEIAGWSPRASWCVVCVLNLVSGCGRSTRSKFFHCSHVKAALATDALISISSHQSACPVASTTFSHTFLRTMRPRARHQPSCSAESPGSIASAPGPAAGGWNTEQMRRASSSGTPSSASSSASVSISASVPRDCGGVGVNKQ